MLEVDAALCDGCRLCEKNCPFGAIVVVEQASGDKLAEVLDTCTLCGACLNMCAPKGLTIPRKAVTPEELARYSGVMVWAECQDRDGVLVPRKVVLELLHKGRELADKLGQPLRVAALGDDRPMDLDLLFAHGADGIVRFRHRLLDRYATDSFATVVSAMIAKTNPSVFLLGATPQGRDLAPRVAARLRLGLTADCTRLDIDGEGQLVQTRPAFGGNIMASIITPYSRPQMATVRPNVFAVGPPREGAGGEIEDFDVVLNRGVIRTRLIDEESLDDVAGPGLEDAQVIVAAGQGCQRPENLELIGQLAELLGGTVAGSRAIVERGWIPHTKQVGQSGTTVSPDLYIAVGISGAVQHLVGMSSSKTIVAINRDPEAPIFKVADFGIVGDAQEILPALIRRLRSARAG